MAKFQVSMEDELLARLDEYADRNFTTRSGAVSLACNQLIMADDIRRSTLSLAFSMKRIAESNEIDEQTKKELQSFEMLAKMFSGVSDSSNVLD